MVTIMYDWDAPSVNKRMFLFMACHQNTAEVLKQVTVKETRKISSPLLDCLAQ